MTTAESNPLASDDDAASVWTPDATVFAPDGTPVAADRNFFAPPPPEVGTVVFAHTTLPQGKRPMAVGLRLVNLLCAGAVVYFGLSYLLGILPHPPQPESIVVMSAALAAVTVLTVWYFTRFSHRVMYVGTDGLAEYIAKGSTRNAKLNRSLGFADAAALRTAQTRHYTNGAYTGTSYTYAWTDAAGRKVAKLGGRYYSAKGRPKLKSPFWLADCGERLWTPHLMPRLAEAFERDGRVDFEVNRGRFVRLGPGWMEFHFKGEPQRITPDQVKSINLNSGHFAVRTNDAKMFSSVGKFDFDYAKMANAQAFLLCLDKLTGFRFGG